MSNAKPSEDRLKAKLVLVIALMFLFVFGVGTLSDQYAQQEQQPNHNTRRQQPSNANNANSRRDQPNRGSHNTEQLNKQQNRDGGALSKKDVYNLALVCNPCLY